MRTPQRKPAKDQHRGRDRWMSAPWLPALRPKFRTLRSCPHCAPTARATAGLHLGYLAAEMSSVSQVEPWNSMDRNSGPTMVQFSQRPAGREGGAGGGLAAMGGAGSAKGAGERALPNRAQEPMLPVGGGQGELITGCRGWNVHMQAGLDGMQRPGLQGSCLTRGGHSKEVHGPPDALLSPEAAAGKVQPDGRLLRLLPAVAGVAPAPRWRQPL